MVKTTPQFERLLDVAETARRLATSIKQFRRDRTGYIAHGLEEVRRGRRRYYREKSLNELIRRASERGDSIC
ncbi:hypothetical protein ACFL02_02045 [Planctomycetota bacterium]